MEAATRLAGAEPRFATHKAQVALSQEASPTTRAFAKAPPKTHPRDPPPSPLLAMPLSTIISAVSKNSTNAGTLAVAPLVLASVGITSYARHAASHTPAGNEASAAQHEHEREEQVHQHVALPWKGTR